MGNQLTPTESMQSGDFLQGMLDVFPESVVLLDRDGCIVRVNRAWVGFVGACGHSEVPDWTGRSYLEACRESGGLSAEEAQALEKGVAAVMEGREDHLEHECCCR